MSVGNKRYAEKLSQVPSASDICPECGSSKFYEDRDTKEIACHNCGYSIDGNKLSSGPERRAYDGEEHQKRDRTGLPLNPMIPDYGMSTVIGFNTQGTSKSAMSRADLYRLRKWQYRVRLQKAGDRSLANGLEEIDRIFSRVEQLKKDSATKAQAAAIYRRAVKEKMIRGRVITIVAYSVIYIAARILNRSVTLDTLAPDAYAIGISRKDIGTSERMLVRELEIKLPLQSSNRYLSKISNRVGGSPKTEALAGRVIDAARRSKLTNGRGPMGIAAASYYIAATLTGERKSQREIAEAANVTEVTIRNRYKEMIERLFIEVPL